MFTAAPSALSAPAVRPARFGGAKAARSPAFVATKRSVVMMASYTVTLKTPDGEDNYSILR